MMPGYWNTAARRVVSGVALVVMVSMPAQARYYDHGHVERRTDWVREQVNARIAQMEMTIVEALRQATGQITANIRTQTAAQERLLSAMTDQQYNLERSAARADAIIRRESAPSACPTLTASRHGGAGDTVSTVVGEQLRSAAQAWHHGSTGAPSAEGRASAVSWAGRQHLAEWSLWSPACQRSSPRADWSYEQWQTWLRDPGTCMADITAATIRRPMLSHREMGAAQAFLRNAYDPFPAGGVDRRTAEESPYRLGALNARASRTSLALEVPLGVVARGTPTLPLADWAASMTAAIPNVNPALQRSQDGRISWNQWMELRTTHRVLNPVWQEDIQEAAPEAVQRELALMAAERLYLDWHQTQLLEQIGLVLSGLLAAQLDPADVSGAATLDQLLTNAVQPETR